MLPREACGILPLRGPEDAGILEPVIERVVEPGNIVDCPDQETSEISLRASMRNDPRPRKSQYSGTKLKPAALKMKSR